MECKKCGAIIPDDGVYCPKCGARADGKKPCEVCGKIIDENSIFCPYCGVRLDGKVCCYACGTPVDKDAVFCPSCGVGLNRYNVAAATSDLAYSNSGFAGYAHVGNRKVRTGKSIYRTVEKYLTPSILLLSLLIAFICSFFVGLTSVLGKETATDTFTYFLKDNFTQIEKLLALPEMADLRAKTPIDFCLYFPAILAAIAVGFNILVSFICLVLGSVKLGIGFTKGESVNLLRYAAFSMGSLVLAAGIIGGYMVDASAINIAGEGASFVSEMTVTYSSGTIVALVLVGIFIIASIILHAITEGKLAVNMRNLSKIICGSALVILCIIMFSVMNVKFISMATEEGKGFITSNSLMFTACTLIILMPTGTDLTGVVVGSIMSYIVLVVLASALAVLIMFLVMKSDVKKDGKISWLITSICIFVFAIIYLVGAVMIKNNLLSLRQISDTLTGVGLEGAIVSLVMAILIFIAAIVNLIMSIVARKSEQNSTADMEYNCKN